MEFILIILKTVLSSIIDSGHMFDSVEFGRLNRINIRMKPKPEQCVQILIRPGEGDKEVVILVSVPTGPDLLYTDYKYVIYSHTHTYAELKKYSDFIVRITDSISVKKTDNID